MAGIDAQEFLKLIDPMWKWITKDKDGFIRVWISKPQTSSDECSEWSGCYNECIINRIGLKINWPSDDWACM